MIGMCSGLRILFWHVDVTVNYLRSLGLSVETTRFSTLSWGIKVQAMGIAGV